MVNSVSASGWYSDSGQWSKNGFFAIDLGTNSIHMVVVQILPTLPAFSIAREKTQLDLGIAAQNR